MAKRHKAPEKATTELVRPMLHADLDEVVKIARRAYDEEITHIDEAPGLEPWSEGRKIARSDHRMSSRDLAEHILSTDPHTCVVAEEDGAILGALMAVNREGMIIISMLAVHPKAQGRGFGAAAVAGLRTLLDNHKRSLSVVRASESIRTMFPWNFDVHPAMRAAGVVDRSKLPLLRHVRDGTADDRDLLIALDRRARGASRGPDHDLFEANSHLFVGEHKTARGYAYAHPNGSPLTVVATSTSLARELLLACLASGPSDGTVLVRNLTSEQRWAFDVARHVGLVLHVAGPVIVRGWPSLRRTLRTTRWVSEPLVRNRPVSWSHHEDALVQNR